jgi:YD repeat-containing protein
MGELDDENDGFKNTQNTPPRIDTWGLDHLGNWAGAYDDPAQVLPSLRGHAITGDVDLNGQLDDDDVEYEHVVDARNELTDLNLFIDDTDQGLDPPVYDVNGNLVADNDFYYQYDAWNRLLRVSEVGDLEFNADGSIDDDEPGAWIVEFVYDALGRLIVTRHNWGGGDMRQAEYFYDGVRRIAEVFTDPIEGYGGSQAIEFTYAVQQGGNQTWTDREYVWSPFYVDDLVVQVDAEDHPLYALQDANENVVGLVNEYGEVLSQYTLDPFGTVRVAEKLEQAHAVNRVAHQGLFAIRLSGVPTDEQLVAGEPMLYYNRNRILDPAKGRPLQRDPNATGLELASALATIGSPLQDGLDAIDLIEVSADGLNLYAYTRSNPFAYNDPSGLTTGSSLDLLQTQRGIASMLNALLTGASSVGSTIQGAFSTAAAYGATSAYGHTIAAGSLVGVYSAASVDALTAGSAFSDFLDWASFASERQHYVSRIEGQIRVIEEHFAKLVTLQPSSTPEGIGGRVPVAA